MAADRVEDERTGINAFIEQHVAPRPMRKRVELNSGKDTDLFRAAMLTSDQRRHATTTHHQDRLGNDG